MLTPTKEDDMHSPNGKRFRRGFATVAAVGAVAILALSGLAVARDHDGGRHHHGPDTGTIASFDTSTGMLAIQLTGGDTVSGLVTRRTKIKCEDEHAPDISTRAREGEPGDDRGDGNSGPGSSHSGPSGHDDNGRGANCTASDLIVGATVQEAELVLKNGKAFFREVELAD